MINMEDKKKIVKMLIPILQETDNLFDLVNLEYKKENNKELVIATFKNGKKIANVTMDSGTSLIRDIIKQIV